MEEQTLPLSTILEHTLEKTMCFLEQLQEERRLLENNQLQELEVVLSEKELILTQISTLYQEQCSFLVKAGVSPDFEGLKTFAMTQKNAERQYLITLTKELRMLAATCQKENNMNGSVILLGKKHHERLLEIVFKRPKSLTYDSKGSLKKA